MSEAAPLPDPDSAEGNPFKRFGSIGGTRSRSSGFNRAPWFDIVIVRLPLDEAWSRSISGASESARYSRRGLAAGEIPAGMVLDAFAAPVSVRLSKPWLRKLV